MLERKDRVIDGDSYSVMQFAPLASLHMQARLFALLGPALVTLAGNEEQGLDQAMAPLVQDLAKTLKPAEFVNLCTDLLRSVSKLGASPLHLVSNEAIDTAFAGKPLTLYKVVAFVLEVNFSDFFGPGGTSGLLGKLKQTPQAPPAN